MSRSARFIRSSEQQGEVMIMDSPSHERPDTPTYALPEAPKANRRRIIGPVGIVGLLGVASAYAIYTTPERVDTYRPYILQESDSPQPLSNASVATGELSTESAGGCITVPTLIGRESFEMPFEACFEDTKVKVEASSSMFGPTETANKVVVNFNQPGFGEPIPAAEVERGLLDSEGEVSDSQLVFALTAAVEAGDIQPGNIALYVNGDNVPGMLIADEIPLELNGQPVVLDIEI